MLLTIAGLFMYLIRYKRFAGKSDIKVINYQEKMIRKLLIHCKNIPYYEQLYKTIDFNPEIDFKSLNDLKILPILTKDTVRLKQEDIVDQNRKKHSVKFRTSGTTGKPITTYISYSHWIIEQSVIWRHWFKAGYKIFDHIAIIRSFNPKYNENIIKKSKLKNWTYYSPYHMTDKNMESYYNDIVKKKTRFLRGYPSSVSIFAEFCSKRDYSIPTLKGILTASEVLSEGERSVIEKTFKVMVYDHYGLAEPTVMLHNYGTGSGYINCDEYGILELMPVENSEYFRIVGTNIHNYAMPLIRYDTGDLAIVDSNANGGINIRKIIGRKDSYIQTLDRKISSVNMYTMMYAIESIRQWQIVQNDIYSLDIYLNISDDDSLNSIKRLIDDMNSTDLEFRYHETSAFILTGEGKIKPFISNVN